MSSQTHLLDAFLKRYPSAKVVKLQYIDLCGTVRCRLVPITSFAQLVRSDGIHPGTGSFADMLMPVNNDIWPAIMDHFTDRAQLIPDLSSLRMAAHDSGKLGNTAVVCCNVIYEDVDPRPILAKTVSKAEKEVGLTFLIGLELEFSLLQKNELIPPPEQQLGLHNSSILDRSQYWPILNQITVALAEVGINIIELHKEYATSQFEIALPPLPPVEAVDTVVYVKETVKDIAWQHGLRATFYPDPFTKDNPIKSGGHIHISANPTKGNTNFDFKKFLGGLVSHVPALCAIGMAQVDSYSRAQEGLFGVGNFVGWGSNNREMPIRLITKNHWEIRFNDATSNPYAMVAAIIGAGLDAKPLEVKDVTRE